MQKRRIFGGLAVLAIGLMLVWGIQASFAAPKGDNPGSDNAAQPTPGQGQGQNNGNGQGQNNGNAQGQNNGNGQGANNGNGGDQEDQSTQAVTQDNPGQSENPGNGNGNSDTNEGPQGNNGNGQGNGQANAPGQNAQGNQDQQAENQNDPGNGADVGATPDHKVLVCHVTSSASHPFQLIEVDQHAVPAHEAHGDIVDVDSAADCEGGTPVAEVPEPEGSPEASPVSDHKVLVCHVTSSETNPFVLIEIDEDAIPAHRAHGDIIGVSSAADCGAGTPIASPIASPVGSPIATPVASPTS